MPTKKNIRPADGTEEIWAYMGRRLLVNGKIGYAWLDPHGDELLYSKLKAAIVGANYEVDVVRKPDGGVNVYTSTVKYVGQSDTSAAKIQEWQLADKAAYAEQQRRSVERKASKEGKLLGDMTLKEIARMIRKSPSQRSALIATVINEINFSDWG